MRALIFAFLIFSSGAGLANHCAAFLLAAREPEDDDTVRLVFADEREENSSDIDPHYIRAATYLARALSQRTSRYEHDAYIFASLAHAQHAEQTAYWNAQLPAGFQFHLHRGLPRQLHITDSSDAVLRQAPEVLRTTALTARGLRFAIQDGVPWPVGLLSGVVRLHLETDEANFAIRRVFEEHRLRFPLAPDGLREFRFHARAGGAEFDLDALVRGRAPGQVEKLWLEGLTGESLRWTLQALPLSQARITHLTLLSTDTQLAPFVVGMLAFSPPPPSRVRELDIAARSVSGLSQWATTSPMASTLEGFRLRLLDPLPLGVASEFGDFVGMPTLRSLAIDRLQNAPSFLAALAATRRGRELEELHLSVVTEAEDATPARSLRRCTNLRSLIVRAEPGASSVAPWVVRSLRLGAPPNLRRLALHGALSERDFVSLGRSNLRGLTELDLGPQPLFYVGMQALEKAGLPNNLVTLRIGAPVDPDAPQDVEAITGIVRETIPLLPSLRALDFFWGRIYRFVPTNGRWEFAETLPPDAPSILHSVPEP